MSDATLKAKEIKKALHSDDPIMSKDTHIFGLVEIFPPNADVAQWPILSFLVKSEHGEDGEESRGLNVHIKAKYIYKVFERPHFINDYMKFGYEDLPEYEVEPEKEWDIKPRIDRPKNDKLF